MKEKKKEPKPVRDMLDKPFFSDKKNVARLVCFVLAFIIAVTAITIGVVQLGKKEPGLYEIEVDADAELPFYASGIHLKYYFDGSSDEIKAQIRQVKLLYASALMQTYQWFDAKNTYTGTPNLAQISQRVGQPVKIQESLFRILQDALERNDRNEGYSIYASPLLHLTEGMLYANDPAMVDPVNEADNRELLAKLEAAIFNNPGTLTLNEEDLTATLNLSEEYFALIREYELGEYGVLHLGTLTEAYRLSCLADTLTANGYTNGYLTTDSGNTLLLGSYGKDSAYCLYSLGESGTPVLSATKAAASGNFACSFRVFALSESEDGFYTIEDSGKTLYRNPYQSTFQTEQPVLSALVVTGGDNMVDATYTCTCILAAKDSATAIALAKSSGFDWLLDLNDKEAKIYSSTQTGVDVITGYQIVLP